MSEASASVSDAPDVIVVGSGPAGTSAALALAESGMRLLVLDAGRPPGPRPPRDPRPYHEIRREDPEQWRRFLGDGLEALRADGPPSPKFDAPAGRFAWEGFAELQGIEGRDFTVVGSLARGGLSNLWGAGFSTWDRADLAEFPLEPEELAPAYRRIAARAGVSNFERDDLWNEGIEDGIASGPSMPLAENARRVWDRYRRRPHALRRLGFRLGRTRHAVLTAPHEGRGACTRCDRCLWGCDEDAIFSAAHDLARLRTFERVTYRPGRLVRRIARSEGGWTLETERIDGTGAAREHWRAQRVVLAASTLASTRLLLSLERRHGERVRLLGSPTVGFATFLPDRLGAALSAREFSMGQLSFVIGSGGDEAVFGSLFSASGIPASRLVEAMPLSRRGAMRLHRWLQPTLLLGNAFLPGRYSRYAVELVARGPDERLVVSGDFPPELAPRLARLRGTIFRALPRLGALPIPGSFHLVPPGADFRYAGTYPMRARPGPGEVDPYGEVHGAPGLHLADLSIFPALPAKSHSLTLMAIADRIGRTLGERWRRERAGD